MRPLQEIIRINEESQDVGDRRRDEILRNELLQIFQQSDVKLAVAKRLKDLNGSEQPPLSGSFERQTK